MPASIFGSLGGGPRISFSGSIAEGATTGRSAGTATVVYAPEDIGTLTWSELGTGTGAALFAINSSTGAVTNTAALDYETATSYTYGIQVTDGVYTYQDEVTISVINVYEEPDLAALGFDDSSFPEDSAKTVNITSAMTGSTLTTGTGSLPAGMTLNSGARTISGTPTTAGSGSVEIIETLADSSNSPRSNTWSWEITEAPALTVYVIGTHGDSRLGGVHDGTAPTYPTDRAYQWVGGGANIGTYTTLTADTLTDVLTPFHNPVTNQGDDKVVPMHFAVDELLDSASPYYLGDNSIIVYSGGGQNGANVAGTGHTLGPLPDSVTVYNVDKISDARTAAAANWPSANIVEVLVTVDGTNDRGTSTPPADLLAAKLDQFIDLRTATGFTSAPIVHVSMTPEATPGLLDTAARVAAAQTSGAYFCQLPSGVGDTHEGDNLGTPVVGIEDAGREHYARSIAIAVGAYAASNPTISTATTITVTESSADEIAFQGNKKLYGTVGAGFESDIELSGDVESDVQYIRPVGGTWPAFTGTSADTIPIEIDWIDVDGKTGTFAADIVVEENVVTTTYLAFDTFNRANTTPSPTSLGTTSGDGSTGNGLTWHTDSDAGSDGSDAYINSNKLQFDYNGSTNSNARAIVDVGEGNVSVEVTINIAAGHPARILAAFDRSTAHGVYCDTGTNGGGDGSLYLIDSGGVSRNIGTFTGLTGIHTFRIDVDIVNSQAALWIDGTNTIPSTYASAGPDFAAACGTWAGVGVEHSGDDHTFEDFKATIADTFDAGSTPLDVLGANLVGWWEAGDLSNAAVSSWSDKSGNGIASALTQGTGANQPVKAATSFNSAYPGITLDGSNDGLSATLTGLATNDNLQVWALVEPSSTSGRVVSTNNGSGNDWDNGKYIPLYVSASGKMASFQALATLSEVNVSAAPHVVAALRSLFKHALEVDGTLGTTTTNSYPSYAPTQLFVGMDNAGGSNFGGVIAAIVVAKGVVSQGKRDAIRAYLNTLGGL